MDSYLSRFEKYGKANEWKKSIWAAYLSALLKGRALDIYDRLSVDDAADYEKSVVHPQFHTTSPLKLLGQLQPNILLQPPGPLGKKNCSNGLGHMTNMAAMPIYGKNLEKSSSPEPLDQ